MSESNEKNRDERIPRRLYVTSGAQETLVCHNEFGDDPDDEIIDNKPNTFSCVCKCDGSLDQLIGCLEKTRLAIARLKDTGHLNITASFRSDQLVQDNNVLSNLLNAKGHCAELGLGIMLEAIENDLVDEGGES